VRDKNKEASRKHLCFLGAEFIFWNIGRQPALRMKTEGLYPKWHGFATYAATRKLHHIGRQPALRMKSEGLYPKWHGFATYAATRKLYHIGRQPALRMKAEGLYPKWHGGAIYAATRKLYPKWHALTSDGGIDEISCSFIWGVL